MSADDKEKRGPCVMCGTTNSLDWMYAAGLVKEIICGDCKVKIGKQILGKMDQAVPG